LENERNKQCPHCGLIGHTSKTSTSCLENERNKQCPHCGLIGHTSITSVNCRQNPNNCDDVQEIIDSVFTQDICQCGDTTHSSTNDRLCPLNPANRNNSRNRDGCKCGSRSHKRISFANCPLNKRFVQNTHANQLSSLDDYITVCETEVSIDAFRMYILIFIIKNL
jgi:hypothetical protein